jgi:PIN domain nuclease of toxin-antitoxin system
MSLLLDTHVVLWWLADDPRLHESARALIRSEPDVFVSSATVWEIAVKQAVGKLEGPEDLPEQVLAAQFAVLDITARHGIAAARLPPHHRDPFDRILVAQAGVERLTLATSDRNVQRYDVSILPV